MLLTAALSALAIAAGPSAAADHPRFPVTPRRGTATTTFRFRYSSSGSDTSGDQLYLYGPGGSRCRGKIAQFPTGFAEGRQTIVMGPGARDRGDFQFGLEPPRGRWCRGNYHGKIRYEGDSLPPVLVGRFSFRVR